MTTTGNQEACCAVLTALLDAREKVDADERLNPVDAQVFGVIVSLLRKGEKASRARIATLAKCAQSSVPRAARKLEACGYLVRGIDKPEGRASAPTGYGIVTDTLGILWDMPSISTDTHSVSPEAPSMDGVEFSGIPSTGSAPEGIQPDTERVSAPPKNNIKPPRTTSTVGSSSEKPETCGEGGLGETGLTGVLFAEPAPPQAAAKPSRKKPVSAMRTDWRPSPEAMAYAADKGLVNGWCEATLENFRDYWISKGEQRADWDATWRSNVRNEVQYKRNLPRGSKTPTQAKYRNGVRRNIYIEAIRSEQP